MIDVEEWVSIQLDLIVDELQTRVNEGEDKDLVIKDCVERMSEMMLSAVPLTTAFSLIHERIRNILEDTK